MMVSPGADTLMEQARLADDEAPLLAVTVKSDLPIRVGVPAIEPVPESRAKPEGSWPLAIVHATDDPPPDRDSAEE